MAASVADPLVCWDCGTPLVQHPDGAEKPCGHTGPMVVSRSRWERLRSRAAAYPGDAAILRAAACPADPHGEDIGDDAMGRRYLWCANCGGEWLVAPDDPAWPARSSDEAGFSMLRVVLMVAGVLAIVPATLFFGVYGFVGALVFIVLAAFAK